MALNIAHCGNGVQLYTGEQLLQHHDNVEVSFEMSPMNHHFKGSKKGKVYLTNQRMIFQSASSSDAMKSISMPFYYMKQVEVKQPVFGANALTGLIKAQPNGGWEGQANFKFVFKSGGAIEFGQTLVRVATKVSETKHASSSKASSKGQLDLYLSDCICTTYFGNPYVPCPVSHSGNPYTCEVYGNPYARVFLSSPYMTVYGNPYGARAISSSHTKTAPKGPPPPIGQAPPPQAQPQFYPPPMPNGTPYGYPTAPPQAGYPPQPGMAPPGGYPPAAGYPPAGGYTPYPNGQPYPSADPAYPPPAYSEVTGGGVAPSAPPATDPKQQTATAPGGNAYYDPANPQQAYIPQTAPAPQYQPPPYSEKPKME